MFPLLMSVKIASLETPTSALGPSERKSKVIIPGGHCNRNPRPKNPYIPLFSDYKLIFNITKHIMDVIHPCQIWRDFRHMWYARGVKIDLGGIPPKSIFRLFVFKYDESKWYIAGEDERDPSAASTQQQRKVLI